MFDTAQSGGQDDWYQDDGGAAGGGAAGGAAQPQWSSQPAGNPAGGGDSGVGGYRSTNAAPVAGADGSAAGGNEDYANEPPLLEELGINLIHIRKKTEIVLKSAYQRGLQIDSEILADADMAGPLVFCLALGGALLLHGKVHFGAIYALALISVAAMYVLLNLMSGGIDIYRVVSVLGYCLLPMVGLAFITIVLPTTNIFSYLLTFLVICWCAATSASIFEAALRMEHQKWLVAYPLFLCYSAFALITIF